jgi:hypothetical protein
VGAVFWRARARSPLGLSCAVSTTWELFVGQGDADVDTSQGVVLDVDRDGRADLVVGGGSGTEDNALLVAHGGPSGPAIVTRLPSVPTGQSM